MPGITEFTCLVKNIKTPVKRLLYCLLIACLYCQAPALIAEQSTIHRDDWYLSQADNGVTIQMSGHASEQAAIDYINASGLSGEIGYYQAEHKNRPWFAVTYGSFNTLDDARRQLASLPENLRHFSPWPRTFIAIKLLIEVASVADETEESAADMSQQQDDSGKKEMPAAVGWEEGQAAYDQGDFSVAFKIWRGLAKQGDALSQFNLGVMYSRGEGTQKNGKRALEWYMRSAEQGYAPAQFNLGAVYLQGDLTAIDEKKAAAWWQMAAEQGFVQAQFNLASLYCRGIGVTRDQDQCKFWYGRAAAIGDTHAQTMLDHIIASENALKENGEAEKAAETEPATEPEASPDVAQEPVTEAAEAEAAFAMTLVVVAEESLMEDRPGSSQENKPVVRRINSEEHVMLRKAQAAFTRNNYMKAHDLWLPLAESGIAEAQYSLGFLYQSGWWPDLDLLQAVAWYTSAAEQNEPRAQFNLGLLLINGEDNVEKDVETGVLWLTRSADADNMRAKEYLIDAYSKGKYGIEKSKEKADYWKSR